MASGIIVYSRDRRVVELIFSRGLTKTNRRSGEGERRRIARNDFFSLIRRFPGSCFSLCCSRQRRESICYSCCFLLRLLGVVNSDGKRESKHPKANRDD